MLDWHIHPNPYFSIDGLEDNEEVNINYLAVTTMKYRFDVLNWDFLILLDSTNWDTFLIFREELIKKWVKDDPIAELFVALVSKKKLWCELSPKIDLILEKEYLENDFKTEIANEFYKSFLKENKSFLNLLWNFCCIINYPSLQAVKNYQNKVFKTDTSHWLENLTKCQRKEMSIYEAYDFIKKNQGNL